MSGKTRTKKDESGGKFFLWKKEFTTPGSKVKLLIITVENCLLPSSYGMLYNRRVFLLLPQRQLLSTKQQ